MGEPLGDRPERRSARRTGFIASAVTLALVVGIVSWQAPRLFGPETPTEALEAPRFLNETTTAGIDQVYDGEFTFFVGGGVAAFDCNDDGRSDLYFAGGTNPAGLYRNESTVGGALRFEVVSDPSTDLTEVTGAYPVDIDSDGLTDLAVLRLGENVLLRGLGECRFERANESWGVDGGDAWTAAFSATWEGSNPYPTLAFGSYVTLDENGRQFGGCSDHLLFRPESDTGYGAPTFLTPGWCTLSILFSDWNRTGHSDLRMTNDRHYYRDGEEQLWRVVDGEPPRLYTRDEGWNKMQIWGMGIASQDVTGDGVPEVLLTSQGDNKLQSLTDGGVGPDYGDIAIRRGTTAHRPFVGDTLLPSTAWHAEFQDVNNDAFVDLFISKGNVEAIPEYAAQDPNNLLMGNPDGTFTEAAEAAGIVDFARSRGAALADFNLDGMLDLVTVNRRENVQLWRNIGWGTTDPEPMGGWLAVQLEQDAPNRDAIGAWVEVEIGDLTVTREVTIGGGHAGDQLGWIHFGLGTADQARIRVLWPDGEVGPWLAVNADQFVLIERGASEPTVWDATSG